MRFEKIEAALQAAQHAEGEHINLLEAERVDVVLVPFDEGAFIHRRMADRYGLVEPPAGKHEAAHMLGEVTRKAEQLACKFDRLQKGRVGRIEPSLADVLVRQAVVMAAPHR